MAEPFGSVNPIIPNRHSIAYFLCFLIKYLPIAAIVTLDDQNREVRLTVLQ